MIKEAINRILELSKPNEIEYEGRKFIDKEVTPLPRAITAKSMQTSFLSSIVDYIQSGADSKSLPGTRFIIHVFSPEKVYLFKELNADKKRDELITAVTSGSRFHFGQFMDLENFVINMQANFVQDEATAGLLSFLSSVKDDTSVTQKDDGVSQKVVTRSGIALSKDSTAPNPVALRPYRTFTEIEQPASSFVFRMKKDDRFGVTAALFEADGSAWEHEAILNIKDYFNENLKHRPIIILA